MLPVRDKRKEINIADLEHIGALTIGALLLFKGFRHRGAVGSLLKMGGLAFLYRGQNGYRRLYDALGIKLPESVTGASHSAFRAQASIVISRAPDELYGIWRNLSNLPVFMDHLLSVTEIDETRSIWVAKLAGGLVAKWDAVIINDVPDRLIAWTTLEGSGVDSAGSVRFSEEGSGKTRVSVVLRYDPPGNQFGGLVARIAGVDPQRQIERDLERFKAIMELGSDRRLLPDQFELR